MRVVRPAAEPSDDPPELPSEFPTEFPPPQFPTEFPPPQFPAEFPPPEAARGSSMQEAMTAQQVALQEQAQLDHVRKDRKLAWYQRRWARVLGVLAVVTIAAAVIPYPLRITSECTVVPSQRIKVRSELGGVISEILVDEGQRVKKGDVLAKLDGRALAADRAKVLAEIEKSEAELLTLRKGRRPEEIEQQKAVLAARRSESAFAAKQASRRVKMMREGVGSRQQAEDAQREFSTKRRAVSEAEAALRLLQAGTRPEEIASHEAVVKRARAELAYIDQKLAMSVVRAPIDGEILTPRLREHVSESVEAGGLVCEIANMQRMRAEIHVPQRFVDAIEVGMPVIVKVESYPSRPFEGKVDFIAPAVDEDKDRRVRVVVELDNREGLLKANMSGYGEVEAGDRSLLELGTRRITRWIRVRFLL
jgi:putative peptide zinc metalloprotease protein